RSWRGSCRPSAATRPSSGSSATTTPSGASTATGGASPPAAGTPRCSGTSPRMDRVQGDTMTNETVTSAGATVRTLSGAIDRVLRPLLPPGTSCALLDFPNHANVGDSAIWLGETEWLRRNGVHVVFACDMEHYSPERLAARLGGGVILLHGGGNLGDFWGAHQQFRERVIQDFPDNPVVQLPQTIHFLDAWGGGEARRVFNAHRNLTLLCRDERSLSFARREFAAASTLCPDLAFALGSRPRPERPSVDVLWLARTDAESMALALPGTGDGVERTDWLD